MKIQNFAILFVIIILPIIIVTSYYMSLQIDTINMQTSYNTKLLDATKEAIEAYEVNTVEWNSDFSTLSDSKRRDIMASINTFTTSFANNIGIGGTSKETILTYIPAIAYTLYDGYYIYSPADTRITIKDKNEVVVTMKEELTKGARPILIVNGGYDDSNEGKILYKLDTEKGSADGTYDGNKFTLDPSKAETEYKHILKPFSAYSKSYEGELDGNKIDVVVNYTLDNYVKIYGKIEKKNEDSTEYEYVLKEGYIIDTDKLGELPRGTISGIKLDGIININKEELKENIAYYTDSKEIKKYENVTYVYTKDKTKVYIDNINGNFIIDYDNKRVNLSSLSTYYKKLTIPKKVGANYSYSEIYQDLNDGTWYRKKNNNTDISNDNREKIEEKDLKKYLGDDGATYENTLKYDYSAINYYVESYMFSIWAKSLNIENENDEIIFAGNPENEESLFNQERREVIKETLISNLNQAITSYSSNSEGEYQLPVLSETDWDQILSNVSIVTFVQNIPIGMKYYNNYAIATSTVNKDYVDPNEIYLNATGDEYYHKPYCEKVSNKNIIGYRNIDYVAKSYEKSDGTTEPYYLHAKGGYAVQSCYYCLIQKDLYKEASGDLKNSQEKAYSTALARERYVARIAKLPQEVESSYWIYVKPIDETTKIINNAKYTVNGSEKEGITSNSKISKDINKTKTYTIEPVIIGESNLDDVLEESLGSLEEPISVIEETKSYSEYSSDSHAEITITRYDNNGITFDVNGNNFEWGSGESDDFDRKVKEVSSDIGNGYINIKLKYIKTHNVIGEGKIDVHANINKKNNITLVSKLNGITGKVKLEFKNAGTTYYYSNIFEVTNENNTIYCEIPDDKWHEAEWEVIVKSIGGTDNLASGTVQYYTIDDFEGLKGFSEAMNEGAISKDRTFYLRNNIDCTGTLRPVSYKNEFNGTFDGLYDRKEYHINNLNVQATSSDKAINYWGLFGINNGTIQNLTLNNPTVAINQIKTEVNKTYSTGAVVGENRGTISNVTISGGTIRGTVYTGGIAGNNKGTISISTVNNGVTIKTLGRKSRIKANTGSRTDNSLYIGGIAGDSSGNIKGCTIKNNSEVGKSSDLEFTWEVTVNGGDDYGKQYIELDNIICIGGIAGRFSGNELTVGNEGNIENVTIGTNEIICKLDSDILRKSKEDSFR